MLKTLKGCWSGVVIVLLLLVIAGPARAEEKGLADQALEAARELIQSGRVEEKTILRFKLKHGNRASFLGLEDELRREWEEATGVLLDIGLMPQEASLSYVEQDQEIDLVVVRNHEYPDLFERGLIKDLSPFMEEFNISLSGEKPHGFVLLPVQTQYNGRKVAIPADGDIALLYLRRDLLEDKQERKRFQDRYGYDLQPPRTWQEYRDQIEFFHRPDEGLYGSVEQRDRPSAWMSWLPRYISQDKPNQYLFDQDMRPLIDSRAGIEATRCYLSTIEFSPQGITGRDAGYDFTLPYFARGEAYSTIITIAGAKIFNRDQSDVAGKYSVHPLPGTEVDGELVRRSTLIYGNNLVISTQSPHPELAFLYAVWATSPEISLRSVRIPGGFVDPYRYHHLDDPEVLELYGRKAVSAFQESLDLTAPAGTGLPGDVEYIQALNYHLDLAARGELSAREAMQRTAEQWEEITERYGIQEQREHWERHRAMYPAMNKVQ